MTDTSTAAVERREEKIYWLTQKLIAEMTEAALFDNTQSFNKIIAQMHDLTAERDALVNELKETVNYWQQESLKWAKMHGEMCDERDALQWKLDAVLNETGQRPLLDKIDALVKQRDVIMVINKDLRRRLCGTGTDVGMEVEE